MSFGRPSRLLGSSSREFQNGSSVQFTVCMARSTRNNHCKAPLNGAFQMQWPRLQIWFQVRDGAFQFINFCKGFDEWPFNRSTAEIHDATSLTASNLYRRPRRPHCYIPSALDGNMPNNSKWCFSGLVPGEKEDSVLSKDPWFPAIRECRGAADCHVGQAGSSYLAMRCDADPSDSGKEEMSWANESVTTASGALAEWRSARTRSGQDIVDWGRYHLQVMFVDRSHRAPSRLAEGLFERIAAWNGFGLILYGHSCGISAIEGELPSMSYQGEAQRLGVARHVFKAPATTLDRSDLDSYDLIVAMNIEVRDEILRMADSRSSNGNDYANKVRLISEFVSYGTTSLLEDNLLEIIQLDLPQALTALEVLATYMSQYSKWRRMVATITMCCAGLIQFLIDAYPDDLPDYDPVD